MMEGGGAGGSLTADWTSVVARFVAHVATHVLYSMKLKQMLRYYIRENLYVTVLLNTRLGQLII